MSMQSLQQAIDRLPRAQVPERDLWSGIEHAINEPAPSTWSRHAALAACLLLVLCSSLYFGTVNEQLDSSNTLTQMIFNLESEHQTNKQALLVQYSNQQAVYQDWEEQMQQLEQAEQAIFKALHEEPDNLELLKILRQVQQKQLSLIETVFSPRLNSI